MSKLKTLGLANCERADVNVRQSVESAGLDECGDSTV